jgi:AraC-like DNA-binding protein
MMVRVRADGSSAGQAPQEAGVEQGRSIAAWLPNESLRRSLVSSVRHIVAPPAESRVEFVGTGPQLLSMIREIRPLIVVFHTSMPSLTTGLLEEMRKWVPGAAFIAVVEPTSHGAKLAIELVRGGMDDLCVVGGISPDAGELARVIDSVIRRKVAEHVGKLLSTSLPAHMRSFIERLWVQCGQPLDVRAAASLYCRHSSTLQRHLRAAGLPPLNQLIVWGRILHAASLLRGGHRSVDSVAAMLDFPSSSALRNQLRRYAAVRPIDLRDHGH